MPKTEPESFETQEYGGEHSLASDLAAARQVTQQYREEHPNPTTAVNVKFPGASELRVEVSTYAQGLGMQGRLEPVLDQMQKDCREFVSFLKKGVKKLVRHELKMTEIKDKGDYSVQKVSMNDRYVVVCWKHYKIA